MTGISGTLFTEELKYQDGTTARWGGDISQQFWKDNRNSTYDSYAFTYDVIGRMLNATYTDHASTSVKFTENVTYDTSGNIQSLERYGRTGSSSYGKIDNLAYTYSGNKLSSVKDTGSAGYSSDFRFSDGTNTTYNYTYDSSGRMTADASKGITSITWNILSQPQTVTFSDGSTISYKYAADGTKLQEVKTAGNTATTDYLGNLIRVNNTNSRLLFGNGYVSLTDNAYHFFITDHLGSVRVVASSTGTAEEYNHYYPLGGLLPSSSSNIGDQPIKFQGKEWGAGNGVDLNLYDFGARRYDPSIGRWLSQDPLAEKYYGHTPYLFCAANPISNIDPYGKDVHPKGDRELEIIRNTLPEEARPYVQINKQGLIDYDLLKQYTGASNNYLSLLEMVKNTQTVSVTVSDSFIYSDRQGVLRKGELSYQEGYPELMDSNIEIVSGLTTGEGGNYGKTLFPDRIGIQNSSTNDIEIYLHPLLSPIGAAEAFSHEGYGHALLYMINGNDHEAASHKTQGMTETNVELKRRILSARKETINNLRQ